MNNDERFVGRGEEYKFTMNPNSTAKTVEERKQNTISEGMKKYMPIGSVVELAGSEQKVMIIGFKVEVDGEVYDYVGCAYPFGITKENSTINFYHDQIKGVFHVGFINAQERYFKSQLSEEDNTKGNIR